MSTTDSLSLRLKDIIRLCFWWKFQTNQFVKGFSHFVGLFLFPNASLLLDSYPTTWGGSFLSTHMEKKRESMCRLLIKRFFVKISKNLPSHFWHSSQPGSHTSVNAQIGLGLQKYYVWAISVSDFSPLNAFLLSILVTFPVCLILRGVLEQIVVNFTKFDVLKKGNLFSAVL